MGKKRESHGVQLLLRAVVKDPDGKVLSDSGQKPSKSFVIQFLEFLHKLFTSDDDDGKATNLVGSESYIYDGSTSPKAYYSFRIGAAVNDDEYGIVVGTGDTAKTNTDYKLETHLTEGAGAGNITHGAMVIETTAIVGANVDLETKRSFTNNTGSTITIKEAGLYTHLTYIIGIAYHSYHCIIRDVLITPIDVPDKCSLTVYYTLRTTV